MFPTLLTIGSFQLHAFGVFVAFGFVAGVAWATYAATRAGVPRDRILDLSFWLLLSGVLGARLLFVFIHLPDFLSFAAEQGDLRGLGEVFAVWNGGIVWYGGLCAAFAVGIFYLRRRKLPVWATFDLFAPGVMLGLAVGRVGSLAAGDGYGRVVENAWAAVQSGSPALWWTNTFSNPSSLVPDDMLGKPLYPTQIAMSLSALAIFLLLAAMRRGKRFHGQLVWSMMLVYAVTSSVIEYYRGDPGRGFLFNGLVSTSQFIGGVFFLLSIGMLVYCRRFSITETSLGHAPQAG